jgi:hypothetical protein
MVHFYRRLLELILLLSHTPGAWQMNFLSQEMLTEMKSTLSSSWQRTEPLARFAGGCLLALTLNACASQVETPAPKVQTFHELMVKLKKGFDEGTLDTPEFYARELGYPLERPETLKVIAPPYTPSRQINFDSGELAGTIAYVRSDLDKGGKKKMLVFNSANTTRRPSGAPCVQLSDIQQVWGAREPDPQVWGVHGPLPVRHYTYKLSVEGRVRVAEFTVATTTGCVGAGYSVAQQ